MKRFGKGKIVPLFFIGAFLFQACIASVLRINDSDETNLNDVKLSQECDCGPYGLCEFDEGQKKCTCTSSTIEFNGKCLECDCGKYSTSCSFSTNGTKMCDCKSNYIDLEGKCTECDCGDDGLCKFEFRKKKCVCRPNYVEVNGKCQACECGPATDSCSLDYSGNKRCKCLPKYELNGGNCTECFCGEKGTCSFENGLKQCSCRGNYAELNGTCEYCGCGEKSHSCYFDENSDKKCKCYAKYADKNGNCEECDCGYTGSCSFENGRKQCNCPPPTKDIDGKCYLVSTTERTTARISTILTSNLPDFETSSKDTRDYSTTSTVSSSTVPACDCGSRGRCTFEYGRKKCICDPFASEKDGKCVDCYCGENSNSCRFNRNGDKVCNCTFGYAPVHGLCFAKCNEDKCVHGKCETGEYGFKCRCDDGFTGERCDEKIQIRPNKQNIWMILLVSVGFGIFILLSGMFCFWTPILSKLSKK